MSIKLQKTIDTSSYMTHKSIFSLKYFAILLVALTVLVHSCDSNKEEKKTPAITEGRIVFKMTYPYYKETFMLGLLPKIMTMEFKDNVYKNTVTQGGLFTTTLISDCNTKKVHLLLDFGPKHIFCELDEGLTQKMVDTLFNPIDIVKVDNFDSIAGLYCEKYIAIYKALDDGYDSELYCTNGVKIENSNWCNQFSEVNDVLLGYEVSQYGLVTRFMADSVIAEPIKITVFDIPDNFKEVSLEHMLYELGEIFKQL